ncbi:MAG: response regulator [Parafilimonas terrae]|uniref:Response regulator n=2 Tax=Methylobacterium mesophilicum TaxID=39956 RepID=A0A6B9FY28_9HYPH|nr:response regulator [Parafilimonas terrae]QGY06096.1 response regulator [Methylobacterium mesophilicum SR1.6/6]
MTTASPRLVYVVDDDPAVLHSTRFLIEGEGHAVETFTDGSGLLAAFPGPRPALILLDHVMKGMDGLEVFDRLRKLDAKVPVVLVTGHPDPGIRARARDAGLPLVEKPLVFDALLDLLAREARDPMPSGLSGKAMADPGASAARRPPGEIPAQPA